MTTTTFDTMVYAKRLEAVGFTRLQAEAKADLLREHAETQSAAVQKILDDRDKELASKGDIQGVRLEIEKVRADMKALELRLLKWQFGIALALAAIMAKGFGWIGF